MYIHQFQPSSEKKLQIKRNSMPYITSLSLSDWPCHVIAVSQVRLRDHGAWPGISQYFISHLAFLLCMWLFFNRASCISLSHISHFYLASCINFTSRIFFSSVIKSHLECPLQTSVIPLTMLNMKKRVAACCSVSVLACGSVPIVMGLCYMRVSL